MNNVMLSKFKKFVFALAVVCTAHSASAFSLIGPFTAWQVPDIGYDPFVNRDIGGPMNRDEEYRWNVKTIYYGYDESFWNFFGPEGTNAVNRAITILNAVTNASRMSSNLVEYPLDTTRPNYTAQALGIMDLKSLTLSALLEEMGLANPQRFVWTLRNRQTIQNVNYFTVVKRNFDPVTWNFSSYVNGVLYEFAVLDPVYAAPVVQYADAVEFRTDSLSFSFNAVASGINGDTVGNSQLEPGYFYTGLTRDDIGGLRYLYLPGNIQYEDLPGNSVGGGSSGAGPWTPIGGTNSTSTNTVVGVALRGGVDKITFKQVRYDSFVGVGAFIVETNVYVDNYYLNGQTKTQNIQRVVNQPDIIFAAEDLGVTQSGLPLLFTRTDTANWVNNDALNGSTTLDGPGIIQGPVFLTYSKIGPYIYGLEGYYPASGATNSLATAVGSLTGFVWGSFDGTTNAPKLFPTDISVPDLEWLVLQGASGLSSPWAIPQLNTTNINASASAGGGGTGN